MRMFTDPFRLDTSTRKRITTISVSILICFTLFSYVSAIMAFESPSSGLRWNSDAYINAPAYSPGDTVHIFGSIEEAESYFSFGNYYFFTADINIRWIVTVKGPDNSLTHMETNILTGISGDQDFDEVTFTLPINAVSGTYTVKVFAWSDWLPTGETRTYVVSEQTFEVA